MSEAYHIPALFQETIAGLCVQPAGVYVDATFGGGGHSRGILEQLGPQGHLYGFDQDLDARSNSIDDDRFTFVRSNFRYLSNFMRYYGVEQLDGLLADLGVSFHHFDAAGRGFSFRFQGPIDMRMNQRAEHSAADILNQYSEQQLADVFYLYGELRQSRQMARAIVRRRSEAPLQTTGQLVETLQPFCGRDKEKKDLTRAFQALRIEVNHELDALKEMLQQAATLIRPGGRIAILTYHSLEDRLVKNFLRSGNFEGRVQKDFYGNPIGPWITDKDITPGAAETERNPRSRSARLRTATRR
ncbi:MAG: 16S rRNA (cytosine(1402)-N(4))-methyltransferase RsmH [Paludibacteraceae bacterium]|nr:16S rRNA (cytosine(1402)-N(4))-methyltransferase RsmH [Paludibacteraceae bacterium]